MQKLRIKKGKRANKAQLDNKTDRVHWIKFSLQSKNNQNSLQKQHQAMTRIRPQLLKVILNSISFIMKPTPID